MKQEFLNARQCQLRRPNAGFDGLVGFLEVVPGKRIDVRANNEIRVALPVVELMFLRGADGSGNNLEHVFRRAAMAVLHADRNSDNDLSAELAGRVSGHGRHETAVGEPASADLNWLEQSREGATRADGINEWALPKDDRIAGAEVCGHDGKRNFHLLEPGGVKDAFDQVREAMVAGEAEPGDTPAGDVAKTNRATGGENAGQRRAAGVRRPKDASDAGARDVRDGDVILFENRQHPEVSEATCESPTQGQCDAGPRGLVNFSAIGRAFHHGGSFANRGPRGQWAARSEILVPMYVFQTSTGTMP